MNSLPLLSICIPTYNRAGFLRECLSSINPDEFDGMVEVVVSDNASTDDTLKVLKAFQSTHLLRYVVQSENLGADRNFDAVVAQARGEYCWLLGDDDALLPDSLSRITNELKKSKPVLLQLGYIQADIDLNPLKSISPNKSGLSEEGLLIDSACYIKSQTNISLLFAFISSFIFRRSCWMANKEEWYGSNYIHLFQMHSALASTRAPKIAHLEKPCVLARGNNPNYITAHIGEIMWLDARTIASLCKVIYLDDVNIRKSAGLIYRKVYSLKTMSSVLAQTRKKIDEKTVSALTYLGYSRFELLIAVLLGRPFLRKTLVYLTSLLNPIIADK